MSHRLMLLTLVLTGALCGVVAVSFHALIDLARGVLIEPALALHGWERIACVIGIPAVIAGALAMVIDRVAPDAGRMNLARVRRAWMQDVSILDTRSVILTFLLTPISLGSGAPLGPEGPTVVITSGFSVRLARLLQLPKKMVRGMIPVGTAAGIAAIFNTPITGVVFAMEEVLGTTSRGVLGGTIVAAVAAAVVERMLVGGHALLEVPAAGWHDVRELFGFAMVGVISGLVSGAAIPTVMKLREQLPKIIPSPVVRASIGGVLFGALGLLVPEILGVGYGTTRLMLGGHGSLMLSGTAFGAKAVAFVIALSCGIIGGVFAPSLFIGATLGSTVGQLAHLFFPGADIQPGAYALVGMGAFFGGMLRCPIASILIVFEVTRDYNLILPLMLAIALSIAISRRLAPISLTQKQLMAEGFDEEAAQRVDPLASLTVAEVMSREFVSVPADISLLEAARLVARSRTPFFPVVDDKGTLRGVLTAAAIDAAARDENLDEQVASRMTACEIVAREDDAVEALIHRLAETDIERCPVVAGDGSNRLVGFVNPGDFLRARVRETKRIKTAHSDVDVFGE